MRVFRIARAPYPVLDGEGASRAGGRWNSRGVPVVYTAGSRALAALEVLAWTDPDVAPLDLLLSEIRVPADASVETVPSESLPHDWQRPEYVDGRLTGDEWARSLRTLVLKVPSALLPEEHNYLLNPRHPDARKLRLVRSRPFEFDPRLLR